MRCPIDDTELKIAERQGIEIDYCPQCRGIWLDRGELDKIIERSSTAFAPQTAKSGEWRENDARRYDDDEHYEHNKRKRGASFLSDLFDF
jgi:Zn-finger nucleic acid-binding protein